MVRTAKTNVKEEFVKYGMGMNVTQYKEKGRHRHPGKKDVGDATSARGLLAREKR